MLMILRKTAEQSARRSKFLISTFEHVVSWWIVTENVISKPG